MNKQKNVLGQDLESCSTDPMTGWFRDGCCNTDKEAGNDLITPHPEFGFPGLKNGDKWCVCASWYARALQAGKGCPIYLKATHEKTLELVPIERLKKFAADLS